MKGSVVITGATSGLGLAYAKEYARQGYDMILTGRRKEKIEQNALKIREETGVNVTVILVDLSKEEGLSRLLEEIKGKRIDVLINNAGFGLKPFFAEVEKEEWEQILFLQVKTVTALTHAILPDMIKRNSGTIINVSSSGAFCVAPRNVLYAATKNYMLTFSEGLYLELIGTNIRVQALCPGFIDTDFHESAGMHVDKKKKGFMKFSSPENIVQLSLKELKKKQVICKPTFDVRFIYFLSRILPKNAFYKMTLTITKKRMRLRDKFA